MMKRRSLGPKMLAVVLLSVLAVSFFASSGGQPMPWDTGLSRLVDNLTGTVAQLLILAAVVISGLLWAFTEHNTGARRISQIVFGGAVSLGAASFLTALGFFRGGGLSRAHDTASSVLSTTGAAWRR